MYQLVNVFVPALVFVSIIHKCQIFNFNFFGEPWLVQIALLYIIGVTLSRVGSLIVQPIMEWVKIINMSEYIKYLKYSDDSIKKMQRTANEFRTYIATFFILYFLPSTSVILTILWLFLMLLFVVSYKKQLKFIQNRLFYNANKEAIK